MPPYLPIKIKKAPLLSNDSETTFTLPFGPFHFNWNAKHKLLPNGFSDEQIQGPFSHWYHEHLFTPLSQSETQIEENITYQLPCSFLSHPLFAKKLKRDLDKLFTYRYDTLKADLSHKASLPFKPLTILITGSSGMVGSTLVSFLSTQGHDVWRLLRKPSTQPNTLSSQGNELPIKELERFDAVINLAGVNIATLWTPSKKKAIYNSRINTTKALVSALSQLTNPPTLINASAVGIYGTHLEKGNEQSPLGTGFLASVCKDWEKEALQHKGRTIITRFGIVLSSKGGFLKTLLPSFKAFLGGTLGNGKQKMSWIALHDLCYHIHYLMLNQQSEGIYNLTSPQVTTLKEFAHLLGKKLHRPSFFNIPSPLVKLLFKELADEMLLSDIEAYPQKLLKEHASSTYESLDKALDHVL